MWGAGPSNGAPPPDVDLSKTIVVGCDGDPTGDAALRFAFPEAQLRSVPSIVFTTFLHPVDPDRDDILTTETELRGRTREGTELALSRALSVPDYRLPPHRLVTGSGEPSSLLLRHYGGAALIVVGERHRSLAHRLVHGAPMPAKLIKHGHVPYAAQSFAVSVLAAVVAGTRHIPELYALAAVSFALKAIVVPLVILALLREAGTEIAGSCALGVASEVIVSIGGRSGVLRRGRTGHQVPGAPAGRLVDLGRGDPGVVRTDHLAGIWRTGATPSDWRLFRSRKELSRALAPWHWSPRVLVCVAATPIA